MSPPADMAPLADGAQRESICISATFTAEPLQECLEFWADELGWNWQVQFAPYNQVFQQLLDPGSLAAQNRSGVNIVLVRPEDWLRYRDSSAAVDEFLEENARQLVHSLRDAAKRVACPFLAALCPASPEREASVRRAEELIRAGLCDAGPLYWLRTEQLLSLYPVAAIHDPQSDQLGHVPYTKEFFAALGAFCVRKIHALRKPEFKVIVLDCDNTLWRGICGEDGPEGVRLDSRRRAFQEFMLAQREAGMLLCLASRNNEGDVLDTFRMHPEFPLQPAHFAARRINWRSKSENLASMAQELDLGLDSFLFIDDSLEECAEVQAARPEVLVLPFSRLLDALPAALDHLWVFDRVRLTEEDRRRSAFYEQQAQRAQLQKEAASLSDFIASLKLDVRITPMAAHQIPRVSQLTLRTNQFNCTTIRRTEREIEALAEQGAECFVVEVSDRFGSYGLTGVVVVEGRGAALWVETFLLSCRVLGRGVEHRVLAFLGEYARRKGLARVAVPFSPTPRNLPALLFLESVGLEFQKSDEQNGTVFEFPAEFARCMEYRPVAPPAATKACSPAPSTHRIAHDYVRIATQLRTVDQMVEAIRARRVGQAGPPTPLEPAGTILEQQIAAIWTELLAAPAVGLHQSFFDLGGHSLLALELLSRIRQVFGVELSLEVVYGSAFTVAGLAKAVESEQIRQLGASEYEALLEEIEALSEDEVRALLDAEVGDGGDRG